VVAVFITHWRSIAEAAAGVIVGLVLILMAGQLITLNTANRQLGSSSQATQSEVAKLEADNASLSSSNAQLTGQNIALQGQVRTLQNQLQTVLGDERVGRSFFEMFLGLLDGTDQHETCNSARFLTTSALRQQCGYVESYYDQIDAAAGG
jgi:hypothetical protein